ncbi:MAG: glycosyltransferase family 4 protein [Actinomycetota bacterium]|nr:glycosyltransferase family 4 protein [Actinomycetota bacterium]
MRVGLVCPYDLAANGGVQDQVLRLSRWLTAAGHEVRVIGPGEGDIAGLVSAGPATVVPANGATTPVALAPAAGRRVLAALMDVDVAHIHEPLMPQVSLTALRRARVPMVGTFHADPSVIAEWVYRLGRPLTSKWFRRLGVITAVSPIAARAVVNTGRVQIIPNGIDVDDYSPEVKRPGSVVFLGRNDERKGLPILLAAWPEIRRAHPAAHLTVVGAENPGPIIAGVEFVGRVSEEDKRRHLKEAAVFCAPNLSGESFGIVVVEAMAAGCAVVATGLPAFVHVLQDSGRFVAPGDSAGLAEEVSSLLQDQATAQRLGKSARLASRRFDRTAVATAYIEAYELALANQ